ncbi:unnamed protein product [Medioppia subpectinata]|uniref:ABC transmembrane type-2 domain-containing protein n=1 Tax=Medioppia subpectinata TaxID=1979941 RepID=A0A7R9KIH0_9ACAR|nr:unnamed protein product [Medioppia subpectinata]CAG2104087.1 unnamed protein product [Medioppia subpectinata]
MSKSVGQLSGGKQRQLSLALALLHQPKLLILDEPTVGTDPELGDKIWRYLHVCCAEEGMSVLLVTHYTEEAHFAHNIGFMRDGRLIEEGVPKLLLDKFQENNLESVFIRLCKYQEKHTITDGLDNSLQTYYELDKKSANNESFEKPIQALEDRVIDVDNAENETIEDSQLRVYIDNSNYIYAQFLIDSLTQTVWSLISDILVENGRARIPPPIQIVETIYAPDSKLSDFLLPGYMIAFIYLSQVTLSSIVLIHERQDGLFDRAIVAGAGHKLIFASHFITGCLMSFINVILMLLIAFIWFDITNYGSYSLVVVLVMAQAINAISLGLLISSLCKESFVAFFLSLFISLSQLFTSGAIFPNESIEPEIRKFLYYSPIAMPTESLRNVMLRGWTFTNFYVYHGFAMNCISGLLFTIIAIIVFKRNS